MIRNILEYLEASTAKYPDKIAYADEETSLSFSQLTDLAKRIGSVLGKTTDKLPVAVFMEKTPFEIAAFMGVVYSGRCYAPIDAQMPVKRIEQILKTLENEYMIVDKHTVDSVPGISFSGKVLVFEELIENAIDEALLSGIRERAIDTDPLYIIFTSGSTGVPKGVVQTHRAVIDFTEWFGETAGFDSKTVFANQAPFYFDMSVKDVYGTLRNGATDYITPHELFNFPTQMFEYLNKNKVNALAWATSAVTMCAKEAAFEKVPLEYVSKICFGGEALPVKVLNIWKKYLPNAMFMNMYGPTETAVDCTYYIVDREFGPTEHLPAGRACRNSEVFILKDGRIVEPGEVGEICVRGTSLAYGYYNNPEKTAEVFVQNPLQHAYPELIYRTGDMGTYNERGEIVFVSREDGQIKHRGFRIELGEIETAVNSIDRIEQCCCLFDKEKDKIILVYSGDITKKEIVLALSNLVPKYMWPNEFHQLERLPMNLNGKIDRPKLKAEYVNG